MTAAPLRRAIVQAMQQLDAEGLNRGSSGNASHRASRRGRPGLLITPTGMAPATLRPADLVWMGEDGTREGAWLPSSEWAMHQAIYRVRPDLQAIVHTHSVHATALACLQRPLPAFHYMVAVAGGDSVPCVPYHTFGTEALSAAVAAGLTDRNACLLAHHGLVAAAPTLAGAMKIAIEIEALCQCYLSALAVGEPATLPADEMARVLEKFRSYGQPARKSAGSPG